MFRGIFVATCALAVAVVGIASPAAAKKAAASPWGTSFVDRDNNGVFSTGDQDLATVLAANGGFYNHTSGARESIVLENVALTEKEPFYFVNVNGNITVRGNYTVKGADGMITFSTVRGDIAIPAGAKVLSKGNLSLQTYSGNMSIGANAQISGSGDFWDTSFTGTTASIGDNVKFSAGGGYHDVTVRGNNSLTVGKNISATGPGHGGFRLQTDGDLTIDRINVRLGYIYVLTGHDGIQSRLHISNSTFNQTYRNGAAIFSSSNNGAYAPDAIVFTNVTITSKGGDVRTYPQPIIK
ncbi:MAG TPA: hypothetical protein VFX21_16645 [Acidimicrobiia bacterium]|nr:hypothetical protein [Acidimicrobiia bacterium]